MDPQSQILTQILARIQTTIRDLNLPLTTIPCWIGRSRQLPSGEMVDISKQLCHISVYPDDQIGEDDAGPPYAADRILISYSKDGQDNLGVQMCLVYSKNNHQTISACHNFLRLLLACHLEVPSPLKYAALPRTILDDEPPSTSMSDPRFREIVHTFHTDAENRLNRLRPIQPLN